MNSKKNKKAVCFDVFGTLLHFGERHSSAYEILADNAHDEIDVRAFMTMNVPAKKLLSDLRLNDLSEIFDGALQFELSEIELYDEVRETLASLKSAGFKIAVCSNLAYEYGKTVLKFLPEVDRHIFSYEVGEAKPNKKIFQAVCDELNMTKEEIFFVGDSPSSDYDGAKRF